MELKKLLGLYSLNWNQIKQTWNFNRFFVLLNRRLRVSDAGLTQILGERRGSTEWALSSRVYRPWHRSSQRWGTEFSPDVLVVAQHGRFGNMIRQVSLAIATAEKLGIREVLVKSLPEFPKGTWVLDNGVSLTHDSLLRPRMIARPSLALGGDFFVKPRLPVEVDGVDFDVIGRSLSEIVGLQSRGGAGEDSLVIHFRSGDAFSGSPHGALGQPPLSFYEKVIAHEKPKAIVLVYEDQANPVIARVQSFIESLGIPYSVSSGGFRDDLEVLVGAKNLVTAQGTLAEAVLLLSSSIERWISFGKNPRLYFRRRALASTVSVFDPSEQYSHAILRGNWRNSPEQQQLMMEFGAEKLELQEWRHSGDHLPS